MNNDKTANTLTSAGVAAAIAASLCCITPVIAVIAGSSSIAANFSWIEPARPYLLTLSIAVLAFAWYLKLRSLKSTAIDCNCIKPERVSFFQSKTFLTIVTVFSLLMMAFPFYSKIFYPKPAVQIATVENKNHKQKIKITVQGMTCEDCEEHINNELSKLPGLLEYKTSYTSGSSLITFDTSKINSKTIEASINQTGYKVKNVELITR